LSESWYVLNARDALEIGANLSRFERPRPMSFRAEFLP
jgi:hypothetical protein